MHPPGLFQILVMALIVVVLFGRGRIGRSLGEWGRGMKAFRQRLDTDEAPGPLPADSPAIPSALDPHSVADN